MPVRLPDPSAESSRALPSPRAGFRHPAARSRRVDLHTVEEIRGAVDSRDIRAWQREVGPGDVLLAGGSWLFSEPQPGARRLLDLTTAGWPPLTETGEGLEIAATATIAQLAAYRPADLALSPSVRRLVRQCCEALLGSFKVWNVATVGGNLCLALPAGPMTALAAALDGTCTVWTRDGGVRRVAAVDVVTGDRVTALGPGEVLRAVTLPAAALSARVAFRRASLSEHGRSAALVIGRRRAAGGVALTVTAATSRPVRLELAPGLSAAAAAAAVDAAVPPGGWFDDVHGAPAWRRHVTRMFAGQLVAELADPAA
jgi:CO/xanthine dehydrogenase FAD-binding subunit